MTSLDSSFLFSKLVYVCWLNNLNLPAQYLFSHPKAPVNTKKQLNIILNTRTLWYIILLLSFCHIYMCVCVCVCFWNWEVSNSEPLNYSLSHLTTPNKLPHFPLLSSLNHYTDLDIALEDNSVTLLVAGGKHIIDNGSLSPSSSSSPYIPKICCESLS